MSTSIDFRSPWYIRLFRSIGLLDTYSFEQKQYQKVDNKPKAPEHGASWNNPYGARQTFSPKASMQAYSGHAYTNAAVTRASQDLAALPIKLIKGRNAASQVIEDHVFYELMDHPNSYTDGFLFREQLITDLILSGNCWILVAGVTKPESLFRLHPEDVKIITDAQRGIIGYEYNSDGNRIMYPPERIIHGRNASWNHGAGGELYGTGAIESLAREINADINAQKLASDASAQGRPDVLLSPVDDADIWGQERRREILDAYKNMARSGGAMVLSGQVRVEELKLTPRDLEFEASRTMARQSISAVIGVPPAILGLEAANYATARQQAINYWTNQTKRGKKLSLMLSKVARLFDVGFRCELDYSGVEALQESRTAQLTRIQMHILNAGMSASDAYKYEGLEDAPVVVVDQETAAQDLGDEEDQNARALVRLFEIVGKAKEDELATGNNKRDSFEALPEPTQKALTTKAKDHNEEHGDDKRKKTTAATLAVSYWRGIGAYKNNPGSVRPSVNSPEQWAMARVNGFLRALATLEFKGRPFDVDLLPEDHPESPKNQDKSCNHHGACEHYEIRGSVGDKDPTNFPSDGDDQSVNLTNSNYDIFPVGDAEDLKDNWPEIWSKGGNIEGNNQYRRLAPIAKRSSRAARTETEEMAIRKREAWAARHEQDFRIAGTVAQIKWLVVGDRGLRYMRNLIEDEKKKITESRRRNRYWNNWIERKVKPAERQIAAMTRYYLRDAAKRYAERVESLVSERRNASGIVTRSIIDLGSLLAIADEINFFNVSVGRIWRAVYSIAGAGVLDQVFDMAGRSVPNDASFGSNLGVRDLSSQLSLKAAEQVANSTGRKVQKIVEKGLLEGLSVEDIAKNVETNAVFDTRRARTIAQTESTRAVNAATLQAYQEAQQLGIKLQKEWVSSGNDGITRDTHLALDGQVVDVDLPFEVEGYSGMSPGEFGDESMDINCRCTIAPIVIDSGEDPV